jgi:hypothetical protein
MASDYEQTDAVVEEAHFRKGLHCLGKTFNNASHAYLSLRLSALNLTTINVSDRQSADSGVGYLEVQVSADRGRFRKPAYRP